MSQGCKNLKAQYLSHPEGGIYKNMLKPLRPMTSRGN